MTDINFDILPQRSALLADHNTEVFALIRAQAPSRPSGKETNRMPLNLSLVLDRSGSMSGKPLEELSKIDNSVFKRGAGWGLTSGLGLWLLLA